MKIRETAEEGVYHVYGYCIDGQEFFRDPVVKQKIIKTFEKAKTRHSFIIQNFIIMNDHYHYVIQTGRTESISVIMHWILTVIAIYINIRFKRHGPVCTSRFKSKLIKTLRYFFNVFRYINRNPVKAGLVKRADDWQYGGLWHFKKRDMTLIGNNPDWVYCLYRKSWVLFDLFYLF